MKKFNLILVSAMLLLSTVSCNSNGTENTTPEGLTGGDIEKSLKPQVSIEKIARISDFGSPAVYQIIINSDTFYVFKYSDNITQLKK